MSDEPSRRPKGEPSLAEQVGARAARKLRARRRRRPVWFGLRMMGVVGWSVAVPTLLGAALGLWLDERRSDQFSWTLALLVAGLLLGCLNVWRWVAKEDEAMREEAGHDDE